LEYANSEQLPLENSIFSCSFIVFVNTSNIIVYLDHKIFLLSSYIFYTIYSDQFLGTIAHNAYTRPFLRVVSTIRPPALPERMGRSLHKEGRACFGSEAQTVLLRLSEKPVTRQTTTIYSVL
jgi:hypothetical protein